jgi:hypothetical protein
VFIIDGVLKHWLEHIGNGSPLYLVTSHMLLGESIDVKERSKVRSIRLGEKLPEGTK